MGKWAGHTYRLKESRKLLVITAYCPCRQTISAITQSVHTINKQQATLILQQTGELVEPRSVFMSDLIAMIQNIEKDPLHSCILMLDANARTDDENDDLYKLLNATTLVDTFSRVTGEPCQIPTNARGTERLDYILKSSCLLPYVKRTGYLAFYEVNEATTEAFFWIWKTAYLIARSNWSDHHNGK
jgi:hypothetical protein